MWKRWGHHHGCHAMALGCPLFPIKGPLSSSQTTPPREGCLSPSSFSPWSRISEIHFPGGFIWKGVATSAALLERGTEVVGVPDVCAITDAPLLCGAGLGGAGARSDGRAGARPAGLHHDLEIGKCTTTSTTSSYSLTKLVVYEGKFSLDVCPPVALCLVDRSWRVVHTVGKILFSMLRTQQGDTSFTTESCRAWPHPRWRTQATQL